MITILGASGNVGSKTTQILLGLGKKLRLIARHADRLKHFTEKGAEIAAGNSFDAEFLAGAFAGSDSVLLMMPGDLASTDKIGRAHV